MRILLYVEGGGESGFGHLRRSEALALECRKRGYTVDFVRTSDYVKAWLAERGWNGYAVGDVDVSSYTAMVIDSYLIAPETINQFASQCKTLVGFHDFGEPNTACTLLISSVFSGPVMVGHASVLAGFEYKIIHPDVLNIVRAVLRDEIVRIAITFGGSPEMSVFIRGVQEEIHRQFPECITGVVAGMSGTEAANAFGTVDIVITGGGQTLFELAYLGVPTIVVSLAENQEAQIARAQKAGFVRVAGNLHDADILDKISAQVRLLSDKNLREEMSASGKGKVDGGGVIRIIDALEQLK